MIERVRAVLVTADDAMLVIRRTKPGIPVYWVLPGGGVEEGDASREAALHREIREEIAGKADIVRLSGILAMTVGHALDISLQDPRPRHPRSALCVSSRRPIAAASGTTSSLPVVRRASRSLWAWAASDNA